MLEYYKELWHFLFPMLPHTVSYTWCHMVPIFYSKYTTFLWLALFVLCLGKKIPCTVIPLAIFSCCVKLYFNFPYSLQNYLKMQNMLYLELVWVRIQRFGVAGNNKRPKFYTLKGHQGCSKSIKSKLLGCTVLCSTLKTPTKPVCWHGYCTSVST